MSKREELEAKIVLLKEYLADCEKLLKETPLDAGDDAYEVEPQELWKRHHEDEHFIRDLYDINYPPLDDADDAEWFVSLKKITRTYYNYMTEIGSCAFIETEFWDAVKRLKGVTRKTIRVEIDGKMQYLDGFVGIKRKPGGKPYDDVVNIDGKVY